VDSQNTVSSIHLGDVTPPVISGTVFVLLFFWLGTALGYRGLKTLRFPMHEFWVWERGLVCAALGVAALQYVPYGLASLGLMKPVYVVSATVCTALALHRDLWRVVRPVPRALRTALGQATEGGVRSFLWLFAAMVFVLLVRAVAFWNSGDDDGYHLSAPKRWLEMGALNYLPTYTHTNASLGFEMLYAVGLSVWGPVGAKVLHFGAGILFLLGVWLCSLRLADHRAGALALALLLVATPVCNLPLLFGVAYADFGPCMVTMAGVVVFLRWQEKRNTSLLVAAALCAGFAGSFKFTALSLTAAWLVTLTLEEWPTRARWRAWTRLVLLFGSVAAIPVLPWLLRNWHETGNPFYPMLPSVFPTRDWTSEQAEVFGQYVRYYSWAVAQGANLTLGHRKAILFGTLVVTLVLGGLYVRVCRRPAERALVVLAVSFMVMAAGLTGMIFRYWLPGLAVLAVVGSAQLARLFAARLKSARFRGYLPALLVLSVALILQLRDWPRRLAELRIASGYHTLDEELQNDSQWQMWTRINKVTPPDAKVLIAAFYVTFGQSSMGAFWVDRTCMATDSHLQTLIRFDTWDSFMRSVKNAGISHVVIADAAYNAGRHGFDFAALRNEYPFARRLVTESGDDIATFRHLKLYRLRER
jgi:hypothetical protein